MVRYALWVAAILSFFLTAALVNLLLPAMQRVRIRRMEPPAAGRVLDPQKAGAPSMGGLAMLPGVLAGLILTRYGVSVMESSLFDSHQILTLTAAMGMTFLFAVFGFIEDFFTEVLGFRPFRFWQKLIADCLLAAGVLLAVQAAGALDTGMIVPGIGYVQLGTAVYPLGFLLILAVLLSADKAEEADGVCGISAFMGFLALAAVAALYNSLQLSLLGASLAGADLAFLLWSFPPSKMYMGRTGTRLLSGGMISLAFFMGWPSLLLLTAAVWLIDALPALIQGLVFLLRRKLPLQGTSVHMLLRGTGRSPVFIASLAGAAGAVFLIFTLLLVRLY